MATTRKITVFTVEGHGEFPFDMLRYDQCWPRSSEDANRRYSRTVDMPSATATSHIAGCGRVTLTNNVGREPTVGRWRSFGWNVTASEIRKVS